MVNIVDWESLGAEHLDKDSTRPTNAVWKAKVTIRTLWEIHFTTTKQLYFDMAYEISINADLVAWFTACQPQWEKEMKLIKVDHKTGEILSTWIEHFHTYNPGEQVAIFEENEEEAIGAMPF